MSSFETQLGSKPKEKSNFLKQHLRCCPYSDFNLMQPVSYIIIIIIFSSIVTLSLRDCCHFHHHWCWNIGQWPHCGFGGLLLTANNCRQQDRINQLHAVPYITLISFAFSLLSPTLLLFLPLDLTQLQLCPRNAGVK